MKHCPLLDIRRAAQYWLIRVYQETENVFKTCLKTCLKVEQDGDGLTDCVTQVEQLCDKDSGLTNYIYFDFLSTVSAFGLLRKKKNLFPAEYVLE